MKHFTRIVTGQCGVDGGVDGEYSLEQTRTSAAGNCDFDGEAVFVGAMAAYGTGKALAVQNVRVVGARIDCAGGISPSAGDVVIDAEGLVLAPGFIDTHNHSGAGLGSEAGAESYPPREITTLPLGQEMPPSA